MKDTKTKFLTSLTTLFVCFAMLLTSTFAWFTDTASTGVNRIESGSLDVSIKMKQGTNWVDAEGQTLAWQKASGHENETVLWEPGATYALPTLKVINNGNLALQFKVLINSISGDLDLLDALEFSYEYSMLNEYPSVDTASPVVIETGNFEGAELKTLPYEISLDASVFGFDPECNLQGYPLDVKSNEDYMNVGYYTIKAHMKEDAGNEYQNKVLSNLSITVVATQVAGFENDSFDDLYDKFAEYPSGSGITNTASVATAAELKTVLTSYADAGSGNSVINLTDDITLADGETWTPVSIDGYNGAGIITINGNEHTIKGLNAPLIAGGFAGNSGVVINDLTLSDVDINDSVETLGLGAFVSSIDSMPRIELNNCHLKDSTIVSTGGARVGGLIGWSAGYNDVNDGPVDTYITVKNCSVDNVSITASGSVGAIIGHAGSNPATYHVIDNVSVTNSTLNSTDDGGWRVGVVVGTANVGEVKISNIAESGNTLSQTGKTAPAHSNLYGRFVPQGTGTLFIDGVAISE